MDEKKINCWEFLRCGRELGGINAYELGVCPVSTYVWFDGLHGGRNAGRTCWVIGGTMCHGNIQKSFDEKFRGCGKCDFYLSVREAEGKEMIPSVLLLNKMEDNK